MLGSASDEAFQIGDVMEIGRNENEESPDQVEEQPGEGNSDGHAKNGADPAGCPVSGSGGEGLSLKTIGAEKFPHVLGDAFPTEEVGAGRTAGNSLPARMVQTTLES